MSAASIKLFVGEISNSKKHAQWHGKEKVGKEANKGGRTKEPWVEATSQELGARRQHTKLHT
jgi:hypothetical protein